MVKLLLDCNISNFVTCRTKITLLCGDAHRFLKQVTVYVVQVLI